MNLLQDSTTTDDTQLAGANAGDDGDQAVAGGGGQKKTPLEILEEILKESQDGEAAKAADGQASGDPSAEPLADNPEASALPSEDYTEEYKQLLEEQKLRDQQMIASQRQMLVGVADTPENQARVSQIEEAQELKEQQAADQDGYTIQQISHTKIWI